jgi:hypothetical protein
MKKAKSIYETLQWHKEAGYEFVMWDCSDPNNYYLVLQEPTPDNLFPTTAFIGFHKSAFERVRNWVRELWQDNEYII